VKLLKASSIHVYLTYPFVASWSLREALACGCTVVGSDTASVREFIVHNQNGQLTPFHNPDELASCLIELFDNPVERARLGSAAREYAERHLDLSTHFRAFESLIADALVRR
jgi:glycosyltransferase involved in cell wall biosynthesis